VVEGIRPLPSLFAKPAAAGASLGAARITVDDESVILTGEPSVTLSGAQVRLPAGAFLQASRESETVVGLVKEGWGTPSGAGYAEAEAGADIFPGSLPRPADSARACPLRRRRPRSAAGRAPRRRPRRWPFRRSGRSSLSHAIQAPARATCASSSMAATASRAWSPSTSSCSRRISSWWLYWSGD
jgi:hypothetical protein